MEKEKIKKLKSHSGEIVSVELKDGTVLSNFKMSLLYNGINIHSIGEDNSNNGHIHFKSIVSISNAETQIWPEDWSEFPKCPDSLYGFNKFEFVSSFMSALNLPNYMDNSFNLESMLAIQNERFNKIFFEYLKFAKCGDKTIGHILLYLYRGIEIEDAIKLIPCDSKYLGVIQGYEKKDPTKEVNEWTEKLIENSLLVNT